MSDGFKYKLGDSGIFEEDKYSWNISSIRKGSS